MIYAPRHVDIWPWGSWKSVESTVTRVASSAMLGMGRLLWTNGFGARSGKWDVALDAGTWTLTLIYGKANNMNTMDWTLGGAALGNLDEYSATTANNLAAQFAGIVVAVPGIYELAFTRPGAVNDYLNLQLITLTRTGS